MLKAARVVKDFLELELCEVHADRMDEYRFNADTNDTQSPGAYSRYGLHWDLLEHCHEKAEEAFGIELYPTYDYCRIYQTGNDLFRHKDRPSCECSLTLNLRNVGDPWEFHWEGGSYAMHPGEAVAYRGCDVAHWREENKSKEVYQVFLHYVDANGPHANRRNEYMRPDALRGPQRQGS